MINIQNLIFNKPVFRTILVFLSIILIYIIPGLSTDINNITQSSFRSIVSEEPADTNIVIIKIDNNDINQLEGWPIKRSYYALLLNYLYDYSPESIGIEVFLAGNLSSQEFYTDLLIEVVNRGQNVILSSLINSTRLENNIFVGDSVKLPAPAVKSVQIKTGHINYSQDNGIIIPGIIRVKDKSIRSFSAALAGGELNNIDKSIKLNFNHSWLSFNSFSLMEFFDLAESKDPRLNIINNKKVLIGVTDPTISRKISTSYDDYMPGVALHAFALQNIINNSAMNYNFIPVSVILFILFAIFISVRIHNNFYLITGSVFLVFYLIGFILFIFIYSQLAYAYFIIPLIAIILYELSFNIIKNSQLLEESYSEKELLHKALKSKEDTLNQLERALEIDDKDETILKKVTTLKSEISTLRKSQQDEEIIESDNFEKDIKDFFGIIYLSRSMHKIIGMIEKVAPQDATVLITGESGSGKELVAQAIHNLSPRKNNNFVAVNCAALTETLLESELFGHKKGSFTNAISDKPGKFESADKGTIFLDEIGETSDNFQAKLLRVLQSGEVQKVGSNDLQFVDARVVAATNKNLEDMVKEKRFREDLYYRLNVININLPPLRDRKEDIAVLAGSFAKRENKELKISKAVNDQLLKNEWKGNIRQLESIIKRASIFAATENRNIIKLNDLPDDFSKFDKSNLETLILDSLREKSFSHSSINETAEELGQLSRTIISENLRGMFFKHYYLNGFDIDKAVKDLAGTEDEGTIEKVNVKANTYLRNIQKALEKLNVSDFSVVKGKFTSKYKNLPIKYHNYLDAIIKNLLSG